VELSLKIQNETPIDKPDRIKPWNILQIKHKVAGGNVSNKESL
jgi:hypothetical protein